ncbi:hypothetical protein RB614_14045 [Phytohabitans sp. ZYX-F-186]|uniref:Uncharacterized protein n=1 Tax=Phytohabitans maris TaxID=3071409 RepID=A0ABU0ZF04_9ACTN|nr:hypothetical protein [Phytohabitans sp. ZYX-F-186]MDQ7905637.1 hypothetical protein [Phytohabitans sp. ZYX-F-186]
MDEFGYVAIQFAAQLPALIVLVVGLALLAARRRTLTGRAGALAVSGCAVLLAGVLLSIAWTSSYIWIYSGGDFDVTEFGLIASGVGLVLTLVHATGLALVIAAVLAGARPAAPPSFPIPP